MSYSCGTLNCRGNFGEVKREASVWLSCTFYACVNTHVNARTYATQVLEQVWMVSTQQRERGPRGHQDTSLFKPGFWVSHHSYPHTLPHLSAQRVSTSWACSETPPNGSHCQSQLVLTPVQAKNPERLRDMVE